MIKVGGKMFALVNTVELGGWVEDGVVRGLISDSYDLVVAGLPRSIRAELERTDRGRCAAVCL